MPELVDSTQVRAVAVVGRRAALIGVKNTVNVLVKIQTEPCERVTPSLHASCVMDKSGSMSGSKLKFAKRAVRKLVKHLNKPDKLHFVAYDSHSTVVFEDGDLDDKEALTDQIRNINAGSCTNLWAGVESAASCLQPRDGQHEESTVKRIFLFSDGLVNEGRHNHAEILEGVAGLVDRGLTVSTFGIGSDFDELLMTKIAKVGKGDYSFLRDAESIPKLVSKSVHSFLSLVGTEAVLDVHGLNGAVVTKVFGMDGEDNELGAHDGGAVLGDISIGDLHSANTKQILVQLELAPTALGATPDTATDILEFKLSYNAPGAAELSDEADHGHKRLSVLGTAELVFTRERADIGAEDHEVAVALAIQRSSDTDDKVLRMTEKGDTSDAVELKEMSINSLHQLLIELQLEKSRSSNNGVNTTDSTAITMLARVLERARDTLSSLKDSSRDARSMCMEMRCEQRIQRAMSVNGYGSGCDSDDGQWSDDGDEDTTGLHCRTVGSLSRAFSGSLSLSDCSDDSYGPTSPNTNVPMAQPLTLQHSVASLPNGTNVFQVEIPSTEKHAGHTFYNIAITCDRDRNGKGPLGFSLNLRARYSAFRELHELAVAPHTQGLKFPPKLFLHSHANIEARRVQLGTYLAEILSNRQASLPPTARMKLWQFIEAASQPKQAVTFFEGITASKAV
jgi:Ca-activated chloride channel family protein